MSKKPQEIDKITLLVIASMIALGGVIYELILSTATSYLIGDSTKSYSLGIGLSLFGMGLGSLFVTRLYKRPLLNFMTAELVLSLIGGTSIIILYAAFSLTKLYWLVFVLLSIIIGILIGFEIPLVMETYKTARKEQNVFLSRVLAADYIGGLLGSIIFPFILVPYAGLIRAAIIMGLINLFVVLLILVKNGRKLSHVLTLSTSTALVLLASLLVISSSIERSLTTKNYQDEVVYFKTTPYQKIVVTKRQDDVRLFLNDQLQFSSRDEARYHETLVHSAMTSSQTIKNVLILGGGDGLAAREVLKYQAVSSITDVDIDPAMTALARDNWQLAKLNHKSFSNPKVHIVNRDAEQFVRQTKNKYDVVIVDLVDPANERIARLFSTDFYREISSVMNPGGVFMTQATSTYFTPRAFWVVNNNVQAVFGVSTPLSINVPSFGEWGFVMSVAANEAPKRQLPEQLVYLNDTVLRATHVLPAEVEAKQNNINSSFLSPKLSTIYNQDLARWSY